MATTGLTVPIVTAGRKKTSVTTNRIRNGQLSEIVTRPDFQLRERVGLLQQRVARAAEEHVGEQLGLRVQRNDDQA